MAYIKYLNSDQIKERDRVGDDDHIIRIHGTNSRVMKNHFDLYVTLMKRASPISRKLREMIAVTVSSLNRCRYWRTHHGAGLRAILAKKKVAEKKIDTLLETLETDFKKADIAGDELAALNYAVKLTKQPYDMTKEDIKVLRTHGFNDRGIHDICAVTSYFAFVNRIADGLGVELEDRFDSN